VLSVDEAFPAKRCERNGKRRLGQALLAAAQMERTKRNGIHKENQKFAYKLRIEFLKQTTYLVLPLLAVKKAMKDIRSARKWICELRASNDPRKIYIYFFKFLSVV
jgi:hypothetical protein